MRREVWRFGAPLVGAELLSQLAMNIDFLLIGRFLGPETLGGYALAYSLATVPQGRLAPALVRVLFPSLARLQDDGESARRSYLGLVRRLALVTFPLLTLLALAGPAAIVGILGSRWAGAAVPLPALCVAGAAYTMATTVGAIYRSQGRPDQELWTTAARALLLAGCVAGAIWGWGTAQAVAIAVAGYALTSTLLFQPVANRLIGLRMRDYLRAMAPGALLAAAVGILGLMT